MCRDWKAEMLEEMLPMAPRCGAGHCGCGGRAPPPEQSQARCDRAHLGPARRWTRWGLGVSGTYGQLGALRF